MRYEKTFLPLAGMRNYGSSHRALLFGSMMHKQPRQEHVLTDKRATHDAGPQISDRGWIAFQDR
jgi:hypothetical protein